MTHETIRSYHVQLTHAAYGNVCENILAVSDGAAKRYAGMRQRQAGHGWHVYLDMGDSRIASRKPAAKRWENV